MPPQYLKAPWHSVSHVDLGCGAALTVRVRSSAGSAAWAWFGGMRARSLIDVTSDPAALSSGGWWAIVATYEGDITCLRFADVRPAPRPTGNWIGPPTRAWDTSLDRALYVQAVDEIREAIAAGTVYQANLCRVLRVRIDASSTVAGLATALSEGNPAPYAGAIDVPRGSHAALPDGLRIVTASPELFLRRNGSVLETGPIKGTGKTEHDLSDKDIAENVMIVDLMRNDLGAICDAGSIEVPALLAVEHHPGLVHLVSTVRGKLRAEIGWPQILAATMPPGSVSGAPKSSAVRLLRALEPVPRGPYCGGIGWVAGERALLAVGIRTFWFEGDELCFGTGAGITWGSDPQREWEETELKAQRLLQVASGEMAGQS